MLNYNGTIIPKSDFTLSFNNRGFTYGDSVFDTSKFINNKIEFLEDHYFRLLASMRMLRMEIPLSFTLDFFENEIRKTLLACNLTQTSRVKFTVFRNDGGLFTPKTNTISYLIETIPLNLTTKQTYKIDLFKDYTVSTDLLNTLKTNNRIINVLSSIFAKENSLDNCLLINQNKNITESSNATVFLIFGNKIYTPPLTDGCIKGIMRKKVIESIQQIGEFVFEEKSLSPFDIQKADSLFLTNSIFGIQTVTNYRKKEFNSYLVDMVKDGFKTYFS